LIDLDVLDVGALEHDVIVDLRAGRDLRANLLATLGAVGLDVLERQGGVNIVDAVKDALIPDLTPGDQADLGSDVVSRVSHGSRRVTRGDSCGIQGAAAKPYLLFSNAILTGPSVFRGDGTNAR
jgi:hypothetical protein